MIEQYSNTLNLVGKTIYFIIIAIIIKTKIYNTQTKIMNSFFSRSLG